MLQEPEKPKNSPPENLTLPEAGNTLEELRGLLVGPERAAIDDLQERLNNPRRRARDLGEVLPEALSSSAQRDGQKLQAVLTPSIEETLRISIRRDPKVLADAIFPVIGPAIRKALSEALSGMIDSLNTLLESTCSLRGLQWRLESFQTGRPFAEIALLHSLEYSVDEVFLIHAESGLLLQHVVDPSMPEKNPDTVAAMLTAIRDFIKDSFQTDDSGSLESATIGNLTLVIEPGPLAVLAGVVRGNPPEGLRIEFRECIETIHNQFGGWLLDYSGDSSPFEAVRPALESCIHKRFSIPPPSARRLILPAALIALAIMAATTYWVSTQMRWSDAVAALKVEPGLIVLDAERRGLGYALSGMRDPLAAFPDEVLGDAGFDPNAVQQKWHTYFSDENPFVLKRARNILQPPNTVDLTFTNGVLRIVGTAPPRWIQDVSRLAALVPGVMTYDDSDAGAAPSAELQRVADEIERIVLLFDGNSSKLSSSAASATEILSITVSRLISQAKAEGVDFKIRVVGHANAVGTESINSQIAIDRARAAAFAMASQGVPEILLQVDGAGDSLMAPDASSPTDPINRRVTFEVQIQGDN